VTSLNTELGPKRLEVLHELVPGVDGFALLRNPNASLNFIEQQAAAKALGIELHALNASNESEIDGAFASWQQLRAGALMINADPLFAARSEQLASLTIRHRVPAISPYQEFARAGGLMSYGANLNDQLRLVGVYTGRILKGEKPADLPVQQSTKVELFINLKAAKSLGLTFPLTLLGRADEVIE
jgi:putative ABC transport system substrate-binding protein